MLGASLSSLEESGTDHAGSPTDGHSSPAEAQRGEAFVHHVDELAELLVTQAIEETGVPVDLMHKIHKLAVVRSLRNNGMFMLRDAVERVSQAIHVSRFTIYNYLHQIEAQSRDEAAETPDEKTEESARADF